MSGAENIYRLFEEIAAVYDSANDRISFGQHRKWKNALARKLGGHIAAGEVLDVCCGSGDVAVAVAKNFPGLQVMGLDFSPAMLEQAQMKAAGLGNIRFTQGDALRLPFADNRFQAACVSFGLRNTSDYGAAIAEMRRVCQDGALICCLDASQPEGVLARGLFRCYFSAIMPLWGGGWRRRGQYRWLNESTRAFLSKRELKALFEAQQLGEVEVEEFCFGVAALVGGLK